MVCEEGEGRGRRRGVEEGLRTALAEAGELPDAFARAFARLALEVAAQRFGADDPAGARECLALLAGRGGRDAEIALRFAGVLGLSGEAGRGAGPPSSVETRSTKTGRVSVPGASDGRWESAGREPVESADEALRRQSQAEIVNEILAGGAVAASVTAAAAVVKARLEATTQREKNRMDMEIERLRIASQERIAGLQARGGQQLPAADANDEEPEA
ncbi:hypothetical protein MHW47_22685 [Streptomyces sp. OfavH-34-F]|uniref:hypothetical protein n=1 Tax=Streptomyces sp. OfavH-34-F TaxID=2917760 RepID=UPI001EF31396|nr:hypothetical protein [Streptomyces sp. OfavH-34-F]MCG7527236.1 hypothetical protein [Streptomyces sp. OfavH-34-F]